MGPKALHSSIPRPPRVGPEAARRALLVQWPLFEGFVFKPEGGGGVGGSPLGRSARRGEEAADTFVPRFHGGLPCQQEQGCSPCPCPGLCGLHTLFSRGPRRPLDCCPQVLGSRAWGLGSA